MWSNTSAQCTTVHRHEIGHCITQLFNHGVNGVGILVAVHGYLVISSDLSFLGHYLRVHFTQSHRCLFIRSESVMLKLYTQVCRDYKMVVHVCAIRDGKRLT